MTETVLFCPGCSRVVEACSRPDHRPVETDIVDIEVHEVGDRVALWDATHGHGVLFPAGGGWLWRSASAIGQRKPRWEDFIRCERLAQRPGGAPAITWRLVPGGSEQPVIHRELGPSVRAFVGPTCEAPGCGAQPVGAGDGTLCESHLRATGWTPFALSPRRPV